MASNKTECNQFGRFWSAVLGATVTIILWKAVEKCYNYFLRNTTIFNARTAGGDDIRPLDDPDNTPYLPVHSTPVTSLGYAISDMDRDIKKGLAYKEDLHSTGATRP